MWRPQTNMQASIAGAWQDPEPRVRAALSECLGALARHSGPRVYERCGGSIVSSINACFVRHHATFLLSSFEAYPLSA